MNENPHVGLDGLLDQLPEAWRPIIRAQVERTQYTPGTWVVWHGAERNTVIDGNDRIEIVLHGTHNYYVPGYRVNMTSEVEETIVFPLTALSA